MTTTSRNYRYDFILIVVFLALFLIETTITLSGFAWTTIPSDRVTSAMLILVTLCAATAGIVFTYSIVSYVQRNEVRHIIILLWGANLVLIAFLFLFTHPSSVWSIFADRIRNRTIVTALGFLLIPGLLVVALAGDRLATKTDKILAILWGIVLQPGFSIILLFSPEPLFHVTTEVGGVTGLTLIGWFNTIIVLLSAILSLIICTKKWIKSRDRNLLSIILAVVLWLESLVIYTLLESPFQVAETLWFSGIIAGFSILGVGMILTSIIEPHRYLEGIVEERTEELKSSKREIEYTLDMWTHKLGNLLQSMTSYLELLDIALEKGEDTKELQSIVQDLTKEATIINRQVSKLSIIKKNQELPRYPVRIAYLLEMAISEVEPLAEDSKFIIKKSKDIPYQIKADSLVDILFVNIILYCLRLSIKKNSTLTVSIDQKEHSVIVSFSMTGARPAEKELEYVQHNRDIPSHTVSLEIYLISLLLPRYHCNIQYIRRDSLSENIIEISFPKISRILDGF